MRLIQTSLVAVLALAFMTASAHTRLAESVPADSAVLTAAPETIELRFSDPVRMAAVDIRRDTGSKHAVDALPSAPQTQFSLAAPALEPGSYVVTWRALSADTHVMTGELSFTITAP